MDWTIRDNRHTSTTTFASPGARWPIIGTGDFNADGVTDILWQNGATGNLFDWQMVNGRLQTKHEIAAPFPDWTYVGNGDFLGAAQADLLFESSTRTLRIWKMQDGAHVSNIGMGIRVPTDFSVATVGDFNGDGVSDVGVYDKHTGTFEVGLVSASGHIGHWSVVGSQNPSTWHFAA